MSGFIEELASDAGLGVTEILAECSKDDASWGRNDLPNTITLRRMLLLVDWASQEPKRWHAYRLFFLEGITSTSEIALKLHVSERTVRRWLQPVHLKIKLKQERIKNV